MSRHSINFHTNQLSTRPQWLSHRNFLIHISTEFGQHLGEMRWKLISELIKLQRHCNHILGRNFKMSGHFKLKQILNFGTHIIGLLASHPFVGSLYCFKFFQFHLPLFQQKFLLTARQHDLCHEFSTFNHFQHYTIATKMICNVNSSYTIVVVISCLCPSLPPCWPVSASTCGQVAAHSWSRRVAACWNTPVNKEIKKQLQIGV